MKKICDLLLLEGHRLFESDPEPVKFTGDQDADNLVNDLEKYPHAFVIGCLLDRQVKAEKAWGAPGKLRERLNGDFDFKRLDELDKKEILALMDKPPAVHWLLKEMSKNVYKLIARIRDVYEVDASLIWRGNPSSAELVYRFLGFRGIGPKIATMASNISCQRFQGPYA